ncbi:site-specific integrase [Devosia neptuniae]|uniref:Site-specific integrase n=1 Tax=Devosia neptuniae TaxID=191302 RepID=A0ABY6CCR5_9HYPH|nr:site-specific integrase [Devosia neptuniae]UXN69608.1 site-specific integrase [Devosia neptuniae]
MPITLRGQSYQVAVSHKGQRYRRQFTSEIEAKTWELDTKLRLTKGELPDMGEAAEGRSGVYVIKQFGKLGEYLIDHHWRNTKGESGATINTRHMIKIIGAETEIDKISTHTINLAIATLRDEGYPDTTINKKLSTVRMALNHALNEGWRTTKLPVIPFFKVGQGRERVFTYAEEADQIAYCKAEGQQDLLDYIVLSYDTGMRQGEALALRGHNLDGDTIVLRGSATKVDRGTKALNTRRIPLTDRALSIILRRMGDEPRSLLFAGFDKDRLRRAWDAMRETLGFTDDDEYVPHAMRHSFCSRLVNDHNVNLLIVKMLAGHLRLETTEKYVHLQADALGLAIAALAPRRNSIYTRATPATGSMPHDNVSCHGNGVVGSIEPREEGKVLELQRKSA